MVGPRVNPRSALLVDGSDTDRSLRFFRRTLIPRALDFNGAVLHQRHEGSDGRQHRCEHGADDAGGEWKLRDDMTLMLDDHPADVAFMNQFFHLLDNVLALRFE